MKIVCLGDSITNGFSPNFSRTVEPNYPQELQFELEKLGISKVDVINSGKNGWRALDALNHLEELVFRHQPDICIIMFGINDELGSNFTKIPSYEIYQEHLIQNSLKLTKRDILPIILSPTPTFAKDVTAWSLKLANNLKVQKTKYFYDFKFIDLNVLIREYITSNNINTNQMFPDNIHLDVRYYYIISKLISNRVYEIMLNSKKYKKITQPFILCYNYIVV